MQPQHYLSIMGLTAAWFFVIIFLLHSNISHRLGKESLNEHIREVIQGDKDSLEAFERFQDHLAANGVRLKNTPAVLGPWLKMDSSKERFFGRFSKRANRLLTRDYRRPFVVPQQV